MPIVTLQAQFRELGRIRTGQQVENKGRRGSHPEKLENFRLTSSSREYLDHAAEVYGGTVEPWEQEWQLVTTSDALDIVLPQGPATLTQWNELWSAGGCQRRCNGVQEMLSGSACLCPPDPADRIAAAAEGEACKPTTRLSVILPQLPDVGVWVLVTHSYYAAVELQGTANLLLAAAGAGRMVPARLRIDQRSVKRPNQPRKDFIVPVIEIRETMAELVGGQLPEIGPAARLALPEPEPLPDDPSFPPPFSREDLIRMTEAAGISLQDAAAVQRQMFPDGPQSDADRHALWAEVSKLATVEPTEAESMPLFDPDEQARIDAAVAAVLS